jgi:hypothetical protein
VPNKSKKRRAKMRWQKEEKNKTQSLVFILRTFPFCPSFIRIPYLKRKKGEESTRWVAYSAHVKALSRAFREPPTNGFGGCGSLAIHHPTGIRTAFNPLLAMNLKSSSTIKVFQWFCHYVKFDN